VTPGVMVTPTEAMTTIADYTRQHSTSPSPAPSVPFIPNYVTQVRFLYDLVHLKTNSSKEYEDLYLSLRCKISLEQILYLETLEQSDTQCISQKKDIFQRF
jgi:hypothetical protein